MLTVSRKKVQKAYKECDRYFCFEDMLEDLFGYKCLPDEDVREDNFTKPEPQPEPKFRIGEKVRCLIDGKVYRIEGRTGKHHYALSELDEYDVHEDCLIIPKKPQTASQPAENVKKSRETESKTENRESDHIAGSDKMVDDIIKDNFRDERRLNFAVQMVEALTQSPEIVNRISSAATDSLLDDIISDALYMTDKLIAACEKGGKQ